MKRLLYLDSLRGIAAILVVLFHLIDPFFLSYNFNLSESTINNAKIISRSIFNGSDWVSFFFVLSGFSLSLSLAKNPESINLKSFYFKRFMRIYPLYLIILLLTYFATYKGDSNFYVLSQTLLFNFRNELVPQSWSLSVELIASLLLPYLFMVHRNNKNAFYYLIFISLFLYNGVNQSQSSALGFTFNFLLGIILSDLYLHEKFLNKKYFLLIFTFITFSFTARWSIDWFPAIKYYVQVLTDFLNMAFHQLFYFISAFGSFLLIYLIISNKFIQRILSNILLVFIGKISFSIYLIHFLIIQVSYHEIVRFLKPIQNSFLESVLSIFIQLLIILFAAVGSYYLIEKPFVDFSKKKANIWFAKKQH